MARPLHGGWGHVLRIALAHWDPSPGHGRAVQHVSATPATSSTANRTPCVGGPNAKTHGRPTETRPAGWNSAAVLQPTLNGGNAMHKHDQPLSSNGKKTVAKRFGPGRITGLALIALLTLALGYLHFSGGSTAVSVPVGRACRPVDAQELYLQHREGRLRRGLRNARGAREPRRPALAADRAAGHRDPCPFGPSGCPDLPPARRPRHHQHGVPGREPVHRQPRRRARRLPRRRRLRPARLPGGELGNGGLR